ncbi:glycosyltransferase [Thalassospira sp. MCCC 1A01428]|uniref:glycosyltransferase n=1 Tax=Thalassospira sp. MCCC 1A01428 TaxID=1470575 RepID=UPI000A1EB09B|nr:glycosyltransferase [Thalassospira sp. MCCC 1A01428]
MYDFSIVTLSFNQKDFIEDCIKSVQQQKDVSIQHIIIDAGSTDGSQEIIRQHKNIEHIFEKDDGPADGLNKGFSVAKGRYYYFLNADDRLFPDILKIVVKKMEKSKNTDLFFFAGNLIDIDGKEIRSIYPSFFSKERYISNATTIFQQGFFFRNEVFEEIKFNVKNKIAWDGEFIFDCYSKNKKPKRYMLKIASFRIHSTAITSSYSYKKKISNHCKEMGKKHNIKSHPIMYRLAKLILDPVYIYHRIFK